mgnify:CR=1 FL=1
MTKTDKLKPAALIRNIDIYKQRLLEEWEELPQLFYTSSTSKQGREDILEYIDTILSEA